MRKSCSMLKGMATFAGEPCARKPARTVRRGEVGKGLAQIPPEKGLWQVEALHSTSPAPYPTHFVKKTLRGQQTGCIHQS